MPSIITTYGWRTAFWVLSGLLATTAVAVIVWLPSPWHRLTKTSDPLEHDGSEGVALWSRLRTLVRQQPVFALLLAGSIAAGRQGIEIVGLYTPGYLHTSLHLSALDLSVILTLLYAGAVVGPILMGTLADRRGHRGTLITNYGPGALALWLVVFTGKDLVALSLFGVAIGIFSYSELSTLQTVFSDYLSPGMSRAGFGVFSTVSQSIGALWIAVIGITVSDDGFRDAFILMAMTFLAAALIVLWGTHKRPAITDQT
jgi:predicted MFS family arabinose efflux permease